MNGNIPRRPAGSGSAARFFQWLWDRSVRDLQISGGPGIRVSRTTRGTVIEATNFGGEESSRLDQYILTDASAGDYFVCRALSVSIDTTDPENPVIERIIGATDIYIAKPFHLRRTPFDRDILNVDDPSAIGKLSEVTYDVEVEVWDDPDLTRVVLPISYNYPRYPIDPEADPPEEIGKKSSTFRIATDHSDPTDDNDDQVGDNWTTQNQTIIPRFAPAVLLEPEGEPITTTTISPTIIYAAQCSGLGITRPGEDDSTVDVTLLALNDGWAWAKTS